MQLFGTKGQKFLHCPGQREDGTSSKSCHGMGQPVKIRDGTWDGTGQSLFFSMISCFRTSFPIVPGCLLLPLSRDKGSTRRHVPDCPGTSRHLETLLSSNHLNELRYLVLEQKQNTSLMYLVTYKVFPMI